MTTKHTLCHDKFIMNVKRVFLFLLLFILPFLLPAPLYADNHGYGQGSCGNGSICYDGNYVSIHLKPGYQCGSLTDWHFGTDGKSPAGVPACGVFGRFCCDPGPGTLNSVTDSSYAPVGCAQKNTSGGCDAVDTAIGAISTNPAGLVGSILRILLSLSGGIAVILIIAGGYQLVVSQGNPEKVKEARERIISAITGLILIIFSVLILQIIGVDLLGLPGFK